MQSLMGYLNAELARGCFCDGAAEMIEDGAKDGIEGIELRRTWRNVHEFKASFYS